MTNLLYITADKIAATSGGGRVTQEESTALHDLAVTMKGHCTIWGRDELLKAGTWPTQSGVEQFNPLFRGNPWSWDHSARGHFLGVDWECNGHYPHPSGFGFPKIVHFYAGTFSETVSVAKHNGCKITYTAAAHDIDLSRQEHQKLGIPFDYPHLNDPEEWNRYVKGYLDADVLICPSNHSANVMRKFGFKKQIFIIPHGVDLPDEKKIAPFPKKFVCGYLGAIGPDKGLIYLLQAWKKLNYSDATLVFAGRDSTSEFMQLLCRHFGGGNIELRGWVNDIADFYNSISVYVQPSITEGFGIEVLEAMSFGRPVICSTGAGAADLVFQKMQFPAGNVDALAEKIEYCREQHLKNQGDHIADESVQFLCRSQTIDYTWEKIRARYQEVWKSLL